ncbi:MAG: twin-arginine translocation signal domain-containing protein [Paraperlucidibaca sp.]
MTSTQATAQVSALSRRDFLRTGAMGGFLLATGSATALLTGCAKSTPASDRLFLREQDIAVLSALIPVVLANALPTGEARAAATSRALGAIDGFVGNTSPAVMDQLYQLFDLLSLPPARVAAAGLWSDWPNASEQDLQAFLTRWQHSSVGLFRAGYTGLVKIITASWYLLPESWPAIGYIAPVRVV